MASVSQFRQSVVRAFMKTTMNKNAVVVGLNHAPGGFMASNPVATPLTS